MRGELALLHWSRDGAKTDTRHDGLPEGIGPKSIKHRQRQFDETEDALSVSLFKPQEGGMIVAQAEKDYGNIER